MRYRKRQRKSGDSFQKKRTFVSSDALSAMAMSLVVWGEPDVSMEYVASIFPSVYRLLLLFLAWLTLPPLTVEKQHVLSKRRTVLSTRLYNPEDHTPRRRPPCCLVVIV